MTRSAVSRPVMIHSVLTIWTLFVTTCSAQEPAPQEPGAKSPATTAAPAAEQLTKIVEAMRGIEVRLKDRETGEETQAAQQSVIDQLDMLLKTPPDSPPPSGSGGGGSSNPPPTPKNGSGKSRNPQNSQSKPSEKKASDPSQIRPRPAGQQDQRDRKNAEDSEERTGPKRTASTPAAKRQRLEVDVWGHLPEKLREQLLNSYGERMLPQYEEAVRRFYDQLADPPASRTRR